MSTVSDAEILYVVESGVAVVTLNAPERRNALTPTMADALVAAFEQADADPTVGAVVIFGAGRSFCAGAELGSTQKMFQDPLDPQVYDGTSRVYDAFYRAGRLKAPVIAGVHGAAVGAGMNLMLAADVRVVADDARLLSGFLRIGTHPGGGHMMLLAEHATLDAACAMAIFGEEIDGRRALELGLAWASVPADQVRLKALAMARYAARDPELARATVRTLRLTARGKARDWALALQSERATQTWAMRRAGRAAMGSTTSTSTST
ncbi:enoyl-CoA hydratase/isomerase family protein [Pseudorhodoferax soli]|uniref:Enoyl-CoA hydratase n=1 Tax=Pseudorhodoferax soli TaxID=545864 RepID=A0A368XNL8_9BURK|nr:enoyl-CoA hydratase/isomerase family protein [Pseudorhodoferax soli]RCW68608.1 enoyl-CoA hydratase [Pseudorhodoferax soli]